MASIKVRLDINSKIFLRDPQDTDLGRRIVRHSILLIDEIGLEQFNFKKLAQVIGSTEASIYRYFENKHFLFIYLLNWYWEWMKFRIDFNTMNIQDPSKKLRIAIGIIVDTVRRNTYIDFVNEDALHRIVVAEGTKGYRNKSVDRENQEGFFLSYKSLCLKIATILSDINPEFPYPRTLASTLVETANNTLYFAEHLPRLTDIKYDKNRGVSDDVIEMLQYLAFSALTSQYQSKSKLAMEELNGHVGIASPGQSRHT